MNFSTRAIHKGSEPERETGAVIPPLYLTSTYKQEAPGHHKGYDYTRAGNPNFTALEEQLAAIENGRFCTVFSSGMGALTTLLSGFSQGDSVIAMEGLYGGTFRLFKNVFSKLGIRFETFNAASIDGLKQMLAKKPRCLLFETPTNPLLEVYDMEQLITLAQKEGVTTIVDNTFATPYFQNPLDFGADVVWLSCTKYIGGHSDILGGALITNSATLKEEFDFGRKAAGTNPGPFDCWLLSRSIKTLAVRMERHQQNAFAVARFLAEHPQVKKVFYPGLETHPTHAIAKKQMRGFSGIVSAEFDLPIEAAKKLIATFSLFTLAESLGGVESLVCHPASMTHASIPQQERLKSGLSDGLVRFSVGIEDEKDLIADLEAALRALSLKNSAAR